MPLMAQHFFEDLFLLISWTLAGAAIRYLILPQKIREHSFAAGVEQVPQLQGPRPKLGLKACRSAYVLREGT